MSAAMTMKMMPSRAKLTWKGSGVRGVEGRAGEALEHLEIACRGGAHDLVRQRRRRSLAVPATGAPLTVEIIAQRLLVEARLRTAGRILLGRPEARAVRREHLVDEADGTVAVASEL